MADETKTCDHSICNCVVSDDDTCGTYCETASNTDTEELACNCGHPGCATEL